MSKILEALISSRCKRTALALLLLRPGEEFYLRQIARLTGENTNSVRIALSQLEKAGLVQSSRQGNLKYFRASEKSPVYEELKSVFSKTEGAPAILSQIFSKTPNAIVAFIYGSVAKGEEGPESDVDVILIGDVSFEEAVTATRKAEETLGREVNVTTFPAGEFASKAKTGFVQRVLKEPVIMLKGTRNELERLAEARHGQKH